ncbi:flp pilus-assembly TadE/G-like family protein [Mycobacterium koreense]|uniref:Putative Flp pilus-assembly TadG-like N-terminal domain-containing protein n=1 Tax=Mycolicibacillus koreensis TaxID=1069220 RepID=A0AA91SRN2_9MYCO|nr:flp pilus-assembly TadE/G-like family protein [Mycolicibacillus koreensis]OSC33708.1 hypothetical protein B8W67_09855 [Mycolicibacillus koreensis]
MSPRLLLTRPFLPRCRSRRPGSRQRNPDGERGSATVLGAIMVVLMLVVTGFGVQFGAVLVARHRAQTAADLAALAAAARLPGGRDRACDRARELAHAMGFDDIDCAIQDLDVVVVVTVPLSVVGVGVPGAARAAARAGPVGAGAQCRPASASSASLGSRSATRPMGSLSSSSTRFTVTCNGTQSSSARRSRSTREVGPCSNSVRIDSIRGVSSGCTRCSPSSPERQSSNGHGSSSQRSSVQVSRSTRARCTPGCASASSTRWANCSGAKISSSS